MQLFWGHLGSGVASHGYTSIPSKWGSVEGALRAQSREGSLVTSGYLGIRPALQR